MTERLWLPSPFPSAQLHRSGARGPSPAPWTHLCGPLSPAFLPVFPRLSTRCPKQRPPRINNSGLRRGPLAWSDSHDHHAVPVCGHNVTRRALHVFAKLLQPRDLAVDDAKSLWVPHLRTPQLAAPTGPECPPGDGHHVTTISVRGRRCFKASSVPLRKPQTLKTWPAEERGTSAWAGGRSSALPPSQPDRGDRAALAPPWGTSPHRFRARHL